MTTAVDTPEVSVAPAVPPARGGSRWVVSDSLVILERHLRQIPRIPEMLAFSITQPIMFVLLFAYVFGGAIQIPGGGSYREWLMAGIFAQTMAFATFGTTIGLAMERQQGLSDRFRSLPMSPAAVLIGRSLADLVRNSITLIVMALCGLLVGWRIHDGIGPAIAGFILLLGLAYAMTWVGVLLGLIVSSPEAAQGNAMMWIFPLTFLSNAFAPTEGMPGWLRTVAEWNPISAIVAACRDLFGNAPPLAADAAWPMQHAVPLAFGWIVLILVVFVPLSIRRYRKADDK